VTAALCGFYCAVIIYRQPPKETPVGAVVAPAVAAEQPLLPSAAQVAGGTDEGGRRAGSVVARGSVMFCGGGGDDRTPGKSSNPEPENRSAADSGSVDEVASAGIDGGGGDADCSADGQGAADRQCALGGSGDGQPTRRPPVHAVSAPFFPGAAAGRAGKQWQWQEGGGRRRRAHAGGECKALVLSGLRPGRRYKVRPSGLLFVVHFKYTAWPPPV
jgi:hypothetical protein